MEISKKGFLGTVAVSGKGYLIITETGLQTELGKIASLLQGGREEQTAKITFNCLGMIFQKFATGNGHTEDLKDY